MEMMTELQEVVRNNAMSLKIIATQVKTSIEAFDEREAADQKRLAELTSLMESNTTESKSLKIAIDAAIKDIQITKLISLGALGVALIAIVVVIL